MTSPWRHSPHSIKQWQLKSLGLQGGETEMAIKDINLDQTVRSQTRFSAWTPKASKLANKQLFNERVNLVGHWYDLWTDKQRKQFLHAILTKSSKSQLKFVQDWFSEEVPVTKVDFTTVIPRILSLYIFSFLNPHDLCSAAQVSWHWKFLSEQDCLWMPKCTKFGWFLPYTPADNEYSAWKRHYISCACSLDYLTPREAAETYGTLNETNKNTEEQNEKLQEKWLRRMLHERLALEKRELFNNRPPWMSGTWKSAIKSRLSLTSSMSMTDQAALQAALWLMKGQDKGSQRALTNRMKEEESQTPSFTLALEKKLVEQSVNSLPKRKNVGGPDKYPPTSSRQCRSIQYQYALPHSSSQLYLVIISSRIPAYEVLLDSVKPSVIPVAYDYYGTTPESLLFCVEKALEGRTAQSIGLILDGDSQHLHLMQGVRICSQSVLNSDIRNFWEKLGSCVQAEKDGGHIDIFVPLAASESGMEILRCLSQIAGVPFCSPTGIATGSFNHLLSEWLPIPPKSGSPPFSYFTDVKLQAWCRLADVMEEALHVVRKQLKKYLSDLQRNVSGRIIGQFMYDAMPMVKVVVNHEVAEALTGALMELAKEKNDDPLEFLSVYLLKKCSKNKENRHRLLLSAENTDDTLSAFLKEDDPEIDHTDKASHSQSHSEVRFQQLTLLDKKLQADPGDKRSKFARELLKSERQYVQILEIVRDVYAAPLKAALSSNRAILSIANVQIIFADILDILQVNKQLLHDLTERLQEWGPAQCLGDVFVNFASRLKTYTNFFNNYTVILKTIDKCREAMPTFRAFLKRHDQTVLTNMMSLQELFLFPSTRFEEYVNLLYALRLHTPPEHSDRKDLNSAILQLKQYKDYIGQLKASLEKDTELTHIQKMIQGCPNLIEANRHLIHIQDVTLLKCANEDISASLRLYEHISDLSLFLFNDALVISSRHISYTPFSHRSKTSYQFMASVSLPRLLLEDIPDTKYVKHAFSLQGPKRQWICSTITEEEKFTWLSACQSAVHASIEKR
ncbi:epithelial cell-transforming sequence 2 oncogene-like [Hyla sarda]|uniref:epithelial cell-transforming sequence 2 oncogene-like n=1 Tax=Hyla sarda TaxID=327740 RepID=UPI0024C306F3|nr:epithelial cell-transforming sequence 2 oncogene-like [Hyla sarda]